MPWILYTDDISLRWLYVKLPAALKEVERGQVEMNPQETACYTYNPLQLPGPLTFVNIILKLQWRLVETCMFVE
jgi:hypothetical protein